MKERNSSKLRVKNLSVTIIGLVCFAIVIWAWRETPVLTTIIPSSDEFDVTSHFLPTVVPSRIDSVDTHNHVKEVPSDSSIEKTQSEEDTEDNSSATTKDAEENMSADESLSREANSNEKTKGDGLKTVNLAKKDESLSRDANSYEKTTGDGLKTVNLDKKDESLSREANSYEKTKGDDLKTVNLDKKECNYAKGKWVQDSRRPLYSGLGCKQWLSEMWSCRLNQRMDTLYENYRWQAKDCEMPDFEGSKFLQKMQHKTIAFVGDSLGRQQFQSLMCMITGGIHYPWVEDIGHQYGLIKARGAKRPDGWAYRFPKTNTTVLYYWSASLCDLRPINQSDPLTSYAMHLDQPVWFLKNYIHKFNVVVLNTGHHWNRGKVNTNRWVMYVNGKPNTDRKIAMIGNAKNLTVHSIARWIDTQIPKYPGIKVFFRTISPRHFKNGDWNTGGSCDNTEPLASGSEVAKDESDDPVIENAVKGTRVKLLDITALSQLRDEGHVSRYSIRAQPGMNDCLHWCLPGVPDTWNELIAAQI